ncbi:diphthine methyltransferase [Scaptodrosophila lebanonensis]|uniref:methylated diphthine methylhydrolase n=1 Tax=Drosophila lebanonensis TaxID=7225 RepID=A0A6J2U127_DROLE|nr:diphthine methyltransferase [Scaptodrosophila lebanonensis]
MKFTTLHNIDTEYSADSVEWCGVDEEHSKYFACGTYQLVEGADEENGSETANRKRKGRIYLYGFDAASGALERLHSVDTAAILDMKWLPALRGSGGPLLATANAIGELEIYELLRADGGRLERRTCLALESKSETPPLALAFDWRRDGDALQLIVSDSLGQISQLVYTPQAELRQLVAWNAHGFEAWTCAFDKWTPQCVYTGGDDGLLNAYDLRTQQRLWTNKAHQAGVTALLSHPRFEHQLLTGSYDEQLRLFDTRAMKRTLAELSLHGGIWRLKPHPVHDELLLIACMYKNFSVVGLTAADGDARLSLLGTYDEHSSICYGADWAQTVAQPSGDQKLLHMATCSFYDHKLCVSAVEID